MYDFIKKSEHVRVSCNECGVPLFETEIVTNFNRPRYGKIKKYRDFIQRYKNIYECEKCAGIMNVTLGS